MFTDVQYKIAKHLTFREADKALFDAKTFCVIKFNPIGYQLINIFQKKTLNRSEFINVAKSLNVSEEDGCQFFEKCLDQGLLVSNNQ